MTVRPIVITGEPVLHRRADPVEMFDDDLRSLVADMFDTMDAANGVGLAAPQIGVGLRVFTWQMDNEDGVPARGAIVNPYVTSAKASLEEPDPHDEAEGCLSVPGESFPLKRGELATITGFDVEVLVATGEGRKDTATHRLSGRARDNRLVHFAVPDGAERPRPGDMVTVGVTYGAPHHLVADAALEGGAYAVRRTAGGDAWASLQDAPVPGKPGVSLGMPGVGRPAPVAAPSCG